MWKLFLLEDIAISHIFLILCSFIFCCLIFSIFHSLNFRRIWRNIQQLARLQSFIVIQEVWCKCNNQRESKPKQLSFRPCSSHLINQSTCLIYYVLMKKTYSMVDLKIWPCSFTNSLGKMWSILASSIWCSLWTVMLKSHCVNYPA